MAACAVQPRLLAALHQYPTKPSAYRSRFVELTVGVPRSSAVCCDVRCGASSAGATGAMPRINAWGCLQNEHFCDIAWANDSFALVVLSNNQFSGQILIDNRIMVSLRHSRRMDWLVKEH